MNRILAFLLCLMAVPVMAQTGSGIVLLTEASHTFTPTTVDSTDSFSFQLVNEVGVSQTVFFGTLEPPFSLADNAPVEIASLDTLEVTVQFTPGAIGSYSGSLSFVGSVFGSADLALSGEGIQVQLQWDNDSLDFGTTAIGQSSNAEVVLTSDGNGAGTISSIEFSSDLFSLANENLPFTIEEGSSDTLTFAFNPTGAGAFSETATLHTNDPNNPTITLALIATGISEVSGEIANMVWGPENSPYTLVGDITVPTGTTLTIEAGTQVIGNGYDIEVFGSFFANGEEGNEVQISVGELLSHTSAENMVLTHTEVTETNEFEFIDTDYRAFRDENIYTSDSLPQWLDLLSDGASIFANENPLVGKYYEDFSDNDCQGWELTYDSWQCPSSLSQTCNGESYNRVYDNCSSNSSGWIRTYSPTFQMNVGELPTSVSFFMDTYNNNWGYNDSYIDYNIAYSIDGAEWIDLENSSSYLNNATKTFDLSSLLGVETIQFRMSGFFRYRGTLRVDNFQLLTNFYPGEDSEALVIVGSPVVAAFGATSLSTGGIQLHESTFNGDFHSVGDSIEVALDNSVIVGNGSRDKDSHGLGIYANHVNLTTLNSNASGHGLDGIHIESLTTDWSATETDVNNNGQDGIEAGASSDLALYGVRIQDNGGRGVAVLDGASLDLDYVLIDDNGGRGIDMGANGQLNADYLRICDSGEEGIYSASSSNISHSNIGFNTGTAAVLTGNNFHTLDNSILWGNNTELYKQIDLEGGILSTSYSLIQGLSTYGVGGAGQYSLGEGLLETDPLLADEEMHLEVYSPCVDGGQPWTQDEYMPYGLGGVRADMGMYGGPENAYWGGSALPNGASAIASVSDSPQDQGNTVGLTFSGSYYDNSDLVNNVTHYAFWRHYDPTGQPVASLADGNWELLGTMPSQSFSGYAYQAATLGNTNDTGPFTSCYTVVAHTDDPDTYWYSNVMCGESVDNLAPNAPDLNGMPLEEGGAQISWADPNLEDYGYTRIVSDGGFEAEVTADTLVVDAGALAGSTVTYTATHFDINGNESEPADLTLVLGSAVDLIPLAAGWNLISLDRTPDDATIASLFGDLLADNLRYVTGFDEGVSFYDPNGLPFLNTLSELTPGYGYWVKVAQDDTLRAPGAPLGGGYLPALDAGWNLLAYTAEAPLAPEAFFADLIADGDLAYLTGFDGGVQVYDPNGLPFLNSLTELNNGFGYWLKTSADYAGMGLVDGTKGNPNYIVLNGASNLGAYAGQMVDVVTDRGTVVAQLPILEGGHLMTTAVYGAEPGQTGLESGTPLYLEFAGQRTEAVAAWTGDMAHIKLEVAFEVAFSVFPNPTTDRSDIRWEQTEAGMVTVELFDAQGRRAATEVLGNHLAGQQQATIAVGQLAPGNYTLRLLVNGRTRHQSALTRAK
ncbi:choice-of-anchor D domain-containing protein [Flavobacteriales bacterium]|nr:choice-of-anchor D domain-containing protein [Flavobacteriales bacterium]